MLVAEFDYFQRVVGKVGRGLPEHVRGECESEAQVAMVEASDEWDPAGGTTYRRFVSFRIEQRMIDQARVSQRIDRVTHRPRNDASLDVSLLDEDGEGGGTKADRLVATGPSSRDPHLIAVAHERIVRLSEMGDRKRVAFVLDNDQAMIELGVSSNRVSQLKRVAVAELVEAGLLAVPPATVQEVPDSPLTDRELAVLHQIANGETNRAIGLDLNISEETVKSHVRHLLKKLDAVSRAQAVNAAWLEGWWEDD